MPQRCLGRLQKESRASRKAQGISEGNPTFWSSNLVAAWGSLRNLKLFLLHGWLGMIFSFVPANQFERRAHFGAEIWDFLDPHLSNFLRLFWELSRSLHGCSWVLGGSSGTSGNTSEGISSLQESARSIGEGIRHFGHPTWKALGAAQGISQPFLHHGGPGMIFSFAPASRFERFWVPCAAPYTF
jgi:hypothetical protein